MLRIATEILKRTALFTQVYLVVAFVILGWPASLYALLATLGARFAHRRYKQLTTLGGARWADKQDLEKAGMLGASSGLILGRVLNHEGTRKPLLRRSASQQRDLVRLPQAVHTAIFAPTGVGKGVSLVIPTLLTDGDRSAVVIDFKGENAILTAEHRRRQFGHRIVLLDPYRKVTQSPDTFNPLDHIQADNPLALDDCMDLANALVVRTGDEKEPHWNDSAESYIAGIAATIVCYGEKETRSLLNVREILSHPLKLDMAVKLMTESDRWGGALAPMGGQLMHFTDKEKSSVLSSALRHLRFLGTPTISDSTRTSSFDPRELRKGKTTVYLILPPDRGARAIGAAQDVDRLVAPGVCTWRTPMKCVQFILDEAAMLGSLDSINDAVGIGRGYGIRLQFYYQSMGQLKRCFPDGQEHTLMSNTTQIYFGVNDNLTADAISTRLGEETIVVESGGSSSGHSNQWTQGVQPSNSGGTSSNENQNWQQQARRLLKPEEVIALSPRIAITFTPGVPPVCTRLIRFYEEKHLGRKPGLYANRFRQAAESFGAVLWCASAIGVAVWVTQALLRMSSMHFDSTVTNGNKGHLQRSRSCQQKRRKNCSTE